MNSAGLLLLFALVASLFTMSFADVGCFSAETTYALCVLNETNVVVVSKNFSGDELLGECHHHFMEEVFDESCPEVTAEETTTTEKSKEGPSTSQRYGYGFLAVFIVSALSLVGLAAVPCIKKSIFQYVLALFTALAVGTLFGDSMFHLIPYTFGLHSHESEGTSTGDGHDHRRIRAADEHDHDHSSITVPIYQWRAFTAVMVLYGFYLLEVFLHWLTNFLGKKGAIHVQSHGHSHAMNFSRPSQSDRANHHNENGHSGLELSEYIRQKSREENRANDHADYQGQQDESAEQPEISRATGWMVILGDGIHNFADGLAIGAAFSQTLMIGLTTTIAVGCHELPHELGDYAVLLQAGFSRCSALMWNFISATTAIIGFFVGSAISSNEGARQWIFAVTVGMFLYIALVDLLPTLLPHGKIEIRRFICVNVGFLLGIAIMFILAIFEDKLIDAGS